MFTPILNKLNCDFLSIDVLVLLSNSCLLLLIIVTCIFIVRFLCFRIFFVFSIIQLCFFNEFLLSFLIILFSLLSLRLLRMFSILVSLVSSFWNLLTIWMFLFILLILTTFLFWLIFLLEIGLPPFLLFKFGIFTVSIIFNKLPGFGRFLLSLWLLFSRNNWHWFLWSWDDLCFLLSLKNLFDLRFMLHHNVLHLFLLLFIGGKFRRL